MAAWGAGPTCFQPMSGRSNSRRECVWRRFGTSTRCQEASGPSGSSTRGACHGHGPEARIPASGGFGHNAQQWNELANSKHRALDCVDCHDPHASAVYTDPTWNPDRGIISDCESCHFVEAANMDTVAMAGFSCVECHMPPASKSAVSEGLEGDVATHLFAINTDPDAAQFYEDDGDEFMSPFLTLEYACERCHSDGGGALVKPAEELRAVADGYHQPAE